MAAFTWSLITPTAKRSVVGVGATSDTFGAGAADGMLLDSVSGFGVRVSADSGQTITTAVSLIAYAKDPYTGRWARAPDWDLPNPSGVTGVRDQYLGGFAVSGPAGAVAYEPSAGAVSSGSLTIAIIATALRTGELL
jgi:hypothetical protein